ncbi:lysosomal Pro-X carboxypeptidase-like [Ornithodoros turicata]|uniref:lysosomal Pro-X carboxypeptidase-like n=1 Tax=Ornithodoros turicata TaxID=34597 RepID=UPI0031387EE5
MEGISFAVVVVTALVVPFVSGCSYETRYFRTKVDHFSYVHQDTFEMRYLISDQHWNSTRGGPIFFYTGNEGGIEFFAKHTGLMCDWAPEFGALLVFAEHRYYGKSLPYGNLSYTSGRYLGYLTSDQTLADYADLVRFLKATLPGAAQSPVVSFGGSYGGMLAAWFRMKYPHLTVAALASSAPVLQFQGLTPCEAFNQIVAKAYHTASCHCDTAIRKSWDVMRDMASTDNGSQELGEIFKMCNILTAENYTEFRDWVYDAYAMLSMINYPYATDFLAPAPAYPVQVACKFLVDGQHDNRTLVEGVYKAISIFTNYTGSLKCHDVGGLTGSLEGDDGWHFQECTEMVAPMCSDGVHDLAWSSPFNATELNERCLKKYNVIPDVDKIANTYGGKHIQAASNIIFSNGNLDPWSGGGILESISETLVALTVEDGAHHYDLRAAHPDDSDSVRAVRAKEKEYIRLWLDQYRQGVR